MEEQEEQEQQEQQERQERQEEEDAPAEEEDIRNFRCDAMAGGYQAMPKFLDGFALQKSANDPTTACNSSFMHSFHAHLVMMCGLLQCAGPATPWGSQEESPGKRGDDEVNRSR